MNCANCGRSIEGTPAFCPGCGTALSGGGPAPPASSPAPSGSSGGGFASKTADLGKSLWGKTKEISREVGHEAKEFGQVTKEKTSQGIERLKGKPKKP